MDSRFQSDEWKIIETRFEPERGRDSESIFALGNGMMGQRANFEERYSGDTLQGTYVAGVYYPRQDRGRLVEKRLPRILRQGSQCPFMDRNPDHH